MTGLRVVLARLRALRGRRRQEERLTEEIETHLALLAEDQLRQGSSPEQARAAARARFGGVEQVKETYRDQRGFPVIEALARDVRFAARSLRRSPGFTAVVVATLALGIGANSAMFGVIDALLLRQLPVPNPEELIRLRIASPGGDDDDFSYSAFQQLRTGGAPVVDLVAASGSGGVSATVSREPEALNRSSVSAAYFTVLGVRAAVGRTFVPDDDSPDSPPVAVLSHRYWTRRFGRDPGVLGRTVAIGATTFTIVGVAAAVFSGETVGEDPDVWTPLRLHEWPRDVWTGHATTWLGLMGRLRPGVDVQQARAALAPIFGAVTRQTVATMRIQSRRSQALQNRLEVDPAGRGRAPARERLSRPLYVLMGVVALVLLIACANVANLLLARAGIRRREISLRMALGAGRPRLVRQLLVEALLLAALGGGLGLLLGSWGGKALAALAPLARQTAAPLHLEVRPDLRVLSFTAALSCLTAIVFGLAPALRAARPDVAATLKQAGPGVTGGGFRLSRIVVIAQIALSLVLLVGAGLFVRSLANLRNIEIGFDANRVLTLRIEGPTGGPAPQAEERSNLYQRMLAAAEDVPGVRAASLSFHGLFSGSRWGNRITVEGRHAPLDEPERTLANAVSPRYFEVMGISLRSGRPFSRADRGDSAPVAIVNETFARRFFAGASPIGRRLGLGAPPKSTMTIVGVVGDAKYGNLREPAATMLYVPFTQYPARLNELQVRTAGDPAAVATRLRRELAGVDRRIAVVSVLEMQDQVDASISGEVLTAKLSSVFGLLALLLSAVGIYGLLAYLTGQRTVEIGVRVALGAGRRQVLWLILRQVLVLVAVGGLLGTVAALFAGRLVASQLYALEPYDPATVVLALVALSAAALAAGAVPARRAASIDPLIALKAD